MPLFSGLSEQSIFRISLSYVMSMVNKLKKPDLVLQIGLRFLLKSLFYACLPRSGLVVPQSPKPSNVAADTADATTDTVAVIAIAVSIFVFVS